MILYELAQNARSEVKRELIEGYVGVGEAQGLKQSNEFYQRMVETVMGELAQGRAAIESKRLIEANANGVATQLDVLSTDNRSMRARIDELEHRLQEERGKRANAEGQVRDAYSRLKEAEQKPGESPEEGWKIIRRGQPDPYQEEPKRPEKAVSRTILTDLSEVGDVDWGKYAHDYLDDDKYRFRRVFIKGETGGTRFTGTVKIIDRRSDSVIGEWHENMLVPGRQLDVNGVSLLCCGYVECDNVRVTTQPAARYCSDQCRDKQRALDRDEARRYARGEAG